MKFQIIFRDDAAESYHLNFKCYETDIAIKWFDVLKKQWVKDNEIKEKYRLYNFPNSKWNEEKLVDEINKSIKIINDPNKVINHLAYIGMPQEQLNHLHHYFEKLRGGVLTPGNYWLNANKLQQNALEYYNVLIHKIENFYSSNNGLPRVVCTFNNKERYILENHDYRHFTITRNFGEVYINYCEVGKTLVDVFKDKDVIIGDDNIRPLKYFSPDFSVHFYNRSKENAENFLSEMNEWWDLNEKKLSALGFVKDDPKNAIGSIPVAMLDTSLSRQEIIELISNFTVLDKIEIL